MPMLKCLLKIVIQQSDFDFAADLVKNPVVHRDEIPKMHETFIFERLFNDQLANNNLNKSFLKLKCLISAPINAIECVQLQIWIKYFENL